MKDSWGCCSVCAKICHKGHTLSERKYGEFFCDCGQAGFCQANIARKRSYSISSIRESDSALKNVVMRTVGIHLLFKRIDRFSEVNLSKRCKKEMAENPNSFVFVYPDIESFETTAKHMSFTSLAEAHALHLRSRLSETGRERMFHVSQTKFEEAIAANPDSVETILTYANVLKEQALKYAPKTDWKLLESVVLKYSEANNAGEIYSLVESLKEGNAYNPSFIELRCQAMSAIYTIHGGIEDIIANHCQGKLDLTGTYGFTQYVMESIASSCSSLSVLNLNDLDPILTDKEIISIISHCANLEEFSISDSDATDETLYKLAQCCPKLRKLDLSWCKLVHGEGFRDITKGCPQLFHINLQGCTNINNSSVAMLALGHAQLTYLNLSGWIPLQDSALEALGKFCAQLQNLYLSSERFTSPSLLMLSSHLTRLELLELVGSSKGVNHTVLESITNNCRNLHSLSLARCTEYNSSSLHYLMKHLRLKSLDISGNVQITGAAFSGLSEYCKNIEFLDLGGCVAITDECIAKVGQYAGENLQSINLSECQITDVGMEALMANCPNITRLNLADTGITDNTLTLIPVRCGKILSLDLSRCSDISYTALSKLVGSMRKLQRLSIVGCKKISKHNKQALQNMYPTLFKSITSRASALADISLQRDSKMSIVAKEDEEDPTAQDNEDSDHEEDVDKS